MIENVIQPLLVSTSGITLAAETAGCIFEIYDRVSQLPIRLFFARFVTLLLFFIVLF